jgi:hypothetical protein
VVAAAAPALLAATAAAAAAARCAPRPPQAAGPSAAAAPWRQLFGLAQHAVQPQRRVASAAARQPPTATPGARPALRLRWGESRPPQLLAAPPCHACAGRCARRQHQLLPRPPRAAQGPAAQFPRPAAAAEARAGCARAAALRQTAWLAACHRRPGCWMRLVVRCSGRCWPRSSTLAHAPQGCQRPATADATQDSTPAPCCCSSAARLCSCWRGCCSCGWARHHRQQPAPACAGCCPRWGRPRSHDCGWWARCWADCCSCCRCWVAGSPGLRKTRHSWSSLRGRWLQRQQTARRLRRAGRLLRMLRRRCAWRRRCC